MESLVILTNTISGIPSESERPWMKELGLTRRITNYSAKTSSKASRCNEPERRWRATGRHSSLQLFVCADAHEGVAHLPRDDRLI
jgi:hypothetical protein